MVYVTVFGDALAFVSTVFWVESVFLVPFLHFLLILFCNCLLWIPFQLNVVQKSFDSTKEKENLFRSLHTAVVVSDFCPFIVGVVILVRNLPHQKSKY
jgi:hypothetical protein